MIEEINNNANNIEYWKKEYLELSKENEELLKFKNAWEELKEDCKEIEKDNDCVLFSRLEQLEKKHGIEVE